MKAARRGAQYWRSSVALGKGTLSSCARTGWPTFSLHLQGRIAPTLGPTCIKRFYVSSPEDVSTQVQGLLGSPTTKAEEYCRIYRSLRPEGGPVLDPGPDLPEDGSLGYSTKERPKATNYWNSRKAFITALAQATDKKATHGAPTGLDPFFAYIRSATETDRGEIDLLINLRTDVLRLLHETPEEDKIMETRLRELDGRLRQALARACTNLRVDLVTAKSAPEILQRIVKYEKVHPLKSVEELIETRLGRGKRCFAVFHEKFPHVPFIFMNVSLEPTIAENMRDIWKADRVSEKDATAAIFYSINSTLRGLSGIDLGKQLIKRSTELLQQELPGLKDFCTLSPIPGFMKWLRKALQEDPHPLPHKNWVAPLMHEKVAIVKKQLNLADSLTPAQTLSKILAESSDKKWYENEKVATALRPLLLRLCAHYLVNERRHDTHTPTVSKTNNNNNNVDFTRKDNVIHIKPDVVAIGGGYYNAVLDSVAHFHLHNGAHLHRLNWLADTSPLRLGESAGMMANYYYPRPSAGTGTAGVPAGGTEVDSNSFYQKYGVISISRDVEVLLRDL
jgi:malonyl-CoA decarboxylase